MPTTSFSAPGPGYRVGSVDRIVLLVWLASPSMAGVRELEAELQRCRDLYPGRKLGLFTLITRPSTQGELSTAARAELIRVLKAHSSVLAAATITYEDEGFRATVVRSVITSIQLILRAKFMTGVYNKRENAVTDLLALPELATLTREELLAAITELLSGTAPLQRAV